MLHLYYLIGVYLFNCLTQSMYLCVHLVFMTRFPVGLISK